MRVRKHRVVFPGLLFVLALASPAFAQAVSDASQPFVTSLIQFFENIPGNFGDERARVSGSLGVRFGSAGELGFAGGAGAAGGPQFR